MKSMQNRTIYVYNDCRKLINRIERENSIVSNTIQDARAIVSEIIDTINNIKINIIIEYTKDKLAWDKIFINNPGSFLVQECDKQSKEIIIYKEMDLIEAKIEHIGIYTLPRDRFLYDKAFIKIVRIINVIKAEDEYAYSKYSDN